MEASAAVMMLPSEPVLVKGDRGSFYTLVTAQLLEFFGHQSKLDQYIDILTYTPRIGCYIE